jgi:hypothetical protein
MFPEVALTWHRGHQFSHLLVTVPLRRPSSVRACVKSWQLHVFAVYKSECCRACRFRHVPVSRGRARKVSVPYARNTLFLCARKCKENVMKWILSTKHLNYSDLFLHNLTRLIVRFLFILILRILDHFWLFRTSLVVWLELQEPPIRDF